MKNNIDIETFLEQLGSEAPTPGGGAAAALTSALGASLILMVTNNTIFKGKCGDYEDLNYSARSTATDLRARLTDCIEKDAEAIERQLDLCGGILAVGDKSDPSLIRSQLQMSKAQFKRAAGHLLKEGKITVDAEEIRRR